jgi:glycosyltransferase involved in cell wall biosynthesis
MLNYGSTISVVVAALNEESGIGPTLSEIQSVIPDHHLIVVDGNSEDNTVEIAKTLGADIAFQPGVGKGDAMAEGLKKLNLNSRYVVFTDADYTYPAKFIPKMVELLERSPNIGMVIGDRFHGSQNQDKASKNVFYIGNRMIATIQYLMNGIKLNDPLSGLRVVRTEIVRNWKPLSKGFDVEVEINAVVERGGYQIAEVPIDYRTRLGEKKLRPRHGIEIFKRIISLSIGGLPPLER